MKTLLCTLAFIMSLSVNACWLNEENWWLLQIWVLQPPPSVIIDEGWLGTHGGTWDTVDFPEAGVVDLPATIWVLMDANHALKIIDKVQIQWKFEGTTKWKNCKILQRLDWDVSSDHPRAIFGYKILNPPGVLTGDKLLIRIHVSDIGGENANLDDDTTADGTNGWADQWVLSLTVGRIKR